MNNEKFRYFSVKVCYNIGNKSLAESSEKMSRPQTKQEA